MPSEYVWKIRAELLEELNRLESAAGIDPGFAVILESAQLSPGEYDARRRSLRRSYFAIGAPALRARMIGLAAELQRRERVETSLERLSAQREVTRAKEGAKGLVLAFAIPFGCVWIGYLIAGLPGELAGIAVAAVVAVLLVRGHRRATAGAVAEAMSRLAIVTERAAALEERPAVFDEREAATGVEAAAFGARSASAAAERVGAASEPISLRDRLRSYSVQ